MALLTVPYHSFSVLVITNTNLLFHLDCSSGDGQG